MSSYISWFFGYNSNSKFESLNNITTTNDTYNTVIKPNNDDIPIPNHYYKNKNYSLPCLDNTNYVYEQPEKNDNLQLLITQLNFILDQHLDKQIINNFNDIQKLIALRDRITFLFGK